MITTILWDVDRTLLDFDAAESAAIRSLFAEFGLGECPEEKVRRYAAINERYWQRMERGEIDKWRESFRENCACAGGIDILIRENFDGMHLKDGTVEKIVELYGYKRVEHVLANTVQERRDDGRFRPDNRAWAESHYIPEDEMHNFPPARVDSQATSILLSGYLAREQAPCRCSPVRSNPVRTASDRTFRDP